MTRSTHTPGHRRDQAREADRIATHQPALAAFLAEPQSLAYILGKLHNDKHPLAADLIKHVDAMRNDRAEMLEALKDIVARWDTPAWKDAEPTAHVIAKARAIIAKLEGGQ